MLTHPVQKSESHIDFMTTLVLRKMCDQLKNRKINHTVLFLMPNKPRFLFPLIHDLSVLFSSSHRTLEPLKFLINLVFRGVSPKQKTLGSAAVLYLLSVSACDRFPVFLILLAYVSLETRFLLYVSITSCRWGLRSRRSPFGSPTSVLTFEESSIVKPRKFIDIVMVLNLKKIDPEMMIEWNQSKYILFQRLFKMVTGNFYLQRVAPKKREDGRTIFSNF